MENKTIEYHKIGIGIKPIITTCNCGKSVTMKYNGNWYSENCVCGRNVRQKGGTLIIEIF